MNNTFHENLLGFNVFNGSLDSLMLDVNNWLDGDIKCHSVMTLNPHSYVTSLNDNIFFNALHSSSRLIPDGIGICLASLLLGGSVKNRITGSDFFYQACNFLNRRKNTSVFFLGSSIDVLEKIKIIFKSDYPEIDYLGHHSPSFSNEFSISESNEIISIINHLKPDVLWVGLTAPKQEKWIFCNADKLDVKLVCGIGAVFDFYSGNIPRASPIFIYLHLEWFGRLIMNPRRLWRRTFISGILFLKILLKEKIKRVFL